MRKLYIVLLAALMSLGVQAQEPDSNFPFINGAVSKVQTHGDYVYVSGFFETVIRNQHIVKQGTSTVTSVVNQAGEVTSYVSNGAVSRAISDGSDGFYLAGRFTEFESVTTRIAHILADGTVDPTFTITANDRVLDLLKVNNDLYVAGYFDEIDGAAIGGLAKVDLVGKAVDSGFNLDLLFLSSAGRVNSLSTDGTHLYIGGAITKVGSETRYGAVKITLSSGALDGWAPDANTSNVTNILYYNGSVYLEGSFTKLNGINADVGRVDATTGATDAGFQFFPNLTFHGFRGHGDYIYLHGRFTLVNGSEARYLVRVNVNTNAIDPSWTPKPNSTVNELELLDGDNFILGGPFVTLGDTRARLVGTTSISTAESEAYKDLHPGSPVSQINAMALSGTNTLLSPVGWLGGDVRISLARFHKQTGVLDETWNPVINDGSVNDFVISGNEMVIGGTFSQVNGESNKGLAKISLTDGSNVSAWSADATDSDGNAMAVNAVVLNSGGNLVVGGAFTRINGSVRSRIGQISFASGSVTSWDAPLNGTVFNMAIDNSDYVYLNGAFNAIKGVSRPGKIAKVSSGATAVVQIFAPTTDGTVSGFAFDGSDNVYMYGDFDNVNAFGRTNIVKLDGTGATFGGFNPTISAGISDVFVDDSNDQILIAGPTFSINGTSRKAVARLSATNGSLDDTFNANLSGGLGRAVYLDDAVKKIYLGGFGDFGSDAAIPNFVVLDVAPEINVKQESASIASGGTFNFGVVAAASSSTKTFTIESIGNAALNLTGTPKVTVSGTDASSFVVDESALAASIAAGDNSTFTVTFNSTGGSKTAALNIASDDPDENPYVINLTGSDGLPQTITFNALPTKTFGEPNFNLSASASSGLSVTFSSSNTGVATVSGNTVTIVGAGTTTITASQSGDNDYAPADNVLQTLTINKAPSTITFATLPAKTFGDDPFSLSAASTSGETVTFSSSNTSVVSVSGNTLTIVGAGSADISANAAANDNYLAATTVIRTQVVNKANPTLSFTAIPSKTFGDPNFALSATVSSGSAITFSSNNSSVATVTGNTVTIVGAGSATITANAAENANYLAASTERELTVSKANQTITFPDIPTKTFGDNSFELEASSNIGTTVTYSSGDLNVATISGSTVTIVGAGSVQITANAAENSNYNAATPISKGLTINKASQVITFAEINSKQFGDNDFNVEATSSGNGSVSFSSSNTGVASVSGNTITIVGVGTTTISATAQETSNYLQSPPVNRVLVIEKGNQTITFPDLIARSVSESSFELGATSSSELALSYTSSNTDVATVAGNTVTIKAVGSTDITASQPGNSNYNAATPITKTLVINDKKSQTITFTELANKLVTDSDFTLTATASSELPVTYTSSNTEVASISGSTVSIHRDGTTEITASSSGNSEYNDAQPVTQTLTVTKVSQVITFAELSAKTFGDPSFKLEVTTSSELEVSLSSSNTDVATIENGSLVIRGAGTTNISASQAGNDTFAAAETVVRELVVSKANQSITFGALPIASINDKTITLGASASSGLEVQYTSSNESVATIDGNTLTMIASGETLISAKQPGDDNYNAAEEVSHTLTVTNKASQTITFTGPLEAKSFGAPSFDLPITASSGLAVSLSSSDENVVTTDGLTVSIVGAGTAELTALQAGNDEYNPAPSVSQSIVINKADQTITFPAIVTKTTNDDPFDLEATISSNLEITFASSNAAVASVSGKVVTIHGPGDTEITASQAGDDNHNPANNVVQKLTVEFVVSIGEDVEQGLIKQYPNPVSGSFHIISEGHEKANFHIYNSHGLEARSGEFLSSIEIDISELKEGIYILRVSTEKTTFTKKILKL